MTVAADPLSESLLAFSAVARAAAEGNPAFGDPLAGLHVTADHVAQMLSAMDFPGAAARFAFAAARLGLDELDQHILAIVAAPELDARWGRIAGYLLDDVRRVLATPRLVARVLAGTGVDPHDTLTALGANARLRTCGAVLFEGEDGDAFRPLADRSLQVAPPLAGVLVGADLAGRDGDGMLRRHDRTPLTLGRDEYREAIARIVHGTRSAWVALVGDDTHEVLAYAADGDLLCAPLATFLDGSAHRRAALVAALEERLLCFENIATSAAQCPAGDLTAALHAADDPGLLLLDDARDLAVLPDFVCHVIEIPEPTGDERRAIWESVLPGAPSDDVAAKFRLGAGSIWRAARASTEAADARGADEPTQADLDVGARAASSSALAELAHRLPMHWRWDDLVLPSRQMESLRSIAAFVRHRDDVLHGWGFAETTDGGGLKAMFAGESGTGKTMAAQVVAADLGLDLHRIDLATVVSKYIGETEKNLDRIFKAAAGSNAIVFFDEADAILGKRSEVRDAHDRYANLETAYLLQRMEDHDGAVVLATNLRSNIDDAFLRRLDFVIDFPFPGERDRLLLWRRMLPEAAPLGDDVDLAVLAARYRLAGGGIRNAALAAAFLAADRQMPISQTHLVAGVALEYAKLGRLMPGNAAAA